MAVNEEYTAGLAQCSYKTYERFLHKAFMGISMKITTRNKILMYCYMYYGISKNQLMTMFESVEKSALGMTLKRLLDINYLTDITIRGQKNDKMYAITSKGINYCRKLLFKYIPALLPDPFFVYEDYTYTLDEIISFIGDNTASKQPSNLNHYLAGRDLNSYLLSSSFAKEDYQYEPEVGISQYGTVTTLYARSIEGIKAKYPLRCDGLIVYPLLKDYPPLRFFLEQDTGSQSSTKLSEKIVNYIKYYLNTDNYSPYTSLLFCLHTHLPENPKGLKEIKGAFGNKHLYKFLALECAIDLLNLYTSNGYECDTVGDALEVIKAKEPNLTLSLNTLLKYFDEAEIDLSTPITEMKQHYYANKNECAQKRLELIRKSHTSTYRRRRSLLYDTASKLTELQSYFIKGFSLYTVHNNDLDRVFPFILSEAFELGSKLKRMLLSIRIIDVQTVPEYVPYIEISVNGVNMCMHNLYTFNGMRMIVENISDDFGGRCRVKHILDQESMPPSLVKTKIVCLCDDITDTEIRQMYLDSPLGRKLASNCGSRIDRECFEVLFATYDMIRTTGYFYSYAADGSIIYKNFIY